MPLAQNAVARGGQRLLLHKHSCNYSLCPKCLLQDPCRLCAANFSPSHAFLQDTTMATRQVFTIDEVLGELDGSAEFEGDSDDDFDGYVDMDDECGNDDSGQSVHVGANVEIGAAEISSGEADSSEELDSIEGPDSVPEYTLEPGCSVHVEGDRPLDYLSLLITDDMLQHIVHQTNLNAEQFISSNDLAPHSRVRCWSKTVHDLNDYCDGSCEVSTDREPLGHNVAFHECPLL